MSKLLNHKDLPAEILVPVQHEFVQSKTGYLVGDWKDKVAGSRHGGFFRVGVAKVPICHHYVGYENINKLMAGDTCSICHKYIASEEEILNTIRIKG